MVPLELCRLCDDEQLVVINAELRHLQRAERIGDREFVKAKTALQQQEFVPGRLVQPDPDEFVIHRRNGGSLERDSLDPASVAIEIGCGNAHAGSRVTTLMMPSCNACLTM